MGLRICLNFCTLSLLPRRGVERAKTSVYLFAVYLQLGGGESFKVAARIYFSAESLFSSKQ